MTDSPDPTRLAALVDEGAWAMHMERVREAAQNYGRDTLLLGKARAHLPDGDNEQFEKAVDARWQAFEQSLFALTALEAAARAAPPDRTQVEMRNANAHNEIETAIQVYGDACWHVGAVGRSVPSWAGRRIDAYDAILALLGIGPDAGTGDCDWRTEGAP